MPNFKRSIQMTHFGNQKLSEGAEGPTVARAGYGVNPLIK